MQVKADGLMVRIAAVVWGCESSFEVLKKGGSLLTLTVSKAFPEGARAQALCEL